MSANTITELRSHLFETLRDLKRDKNPMDIERAMAVSEVAQTIINSAKVEVDHLRVTGGRGSGFIPDTTPGLPGDAGNTVITERPGVRVTQHRLKG